MRAILLCLLSITLFASFAQLPRVTNGRIERVDNFQSKYVNPRNVDVWIPSDYTTKKKYAVLYMHDGQMLFDASTTWNKMSWEADEVVGELIAKGEIPDLIIVGIWNGGTTRHADYFPQKPFESLTDVQKDTVIKQLQNAGRTTDSFQPVSDGYLKFIVSELKPFIDRKYSTYTDRKHTFIAGSSMGGLISVYAICEYPNVFGGAACLSTHWPGIFSMVNNPIPDAFLKYLNTNLPDPKTHKIYFDYGDQTLDALYPPLQKKVDEVMKQKGFNDRNWMTRYFPGEDHSEKAWKNRLDVPVSFLLKK